MNNTQVPSRPDPQVLKELLEKVAGADQSAFSALYEHVAARLLGIQLRILRDRDLAEEALQETFIKVWNNAASFDADKASAQVWLNSLARNQALDALRRIKLRAPLNLHSPVIDLDLKADSARPVLDSLADEEVLSTCLDRLAPDARQCIVGIYCEGFSHDELSESLKRPLGTVKSWIRRGLLTLRKCLDELA